MASQPSARSFASVAGERSITACLEIFTSRPPRRPRVERVGAVERRQRIDLGVAQPVERAAQDHLGASRRLRREQFDDVVARRLADGDDAQVRVMAQPSSATASVSFQASPTASPGAREARSPACVSRTSIEGPAAGRTRSRVEPPR